MKRRQSRSSSTSAKASKPEFDFFASHFGTNLEDAVAEKLVAGSGNQKKAIQFDAFPNASCTLAFNENCNEIYDTDVTRSLGLESFNINPQALKNYVELLDEEWSPEMNAYYQVIGRYLDLAAVTTDTRYVSMIGLHATNHILKTRELIISNNAKLEKAAKSGTTTDELVESCRDQGLSRPKVVIMTPMKKFAYEFVHAICDAYFGAAKKRTILSSERFEEEYSSQAAYLPSKKRKDSYQQLMTGNIDDCFRMGLRFGKNSIKLYQKFEQSDMLICSPLGLRMIVGDDGEVGRESDFLAGVEVLVIDRIDLFAMQNWEHLLHIVQATNDSPATVATDITRLRPWSLAKLGRFYRQTIAFSSYNFNELQGIIVSDFKNYAGTLTVFPKPESILPTIEKQLIQEFHRFDSKSIATSADDRFAYFVHHILPTLEPGTLIFVSSYFDFIRLRNHLKRENESFVQLHEYAKDNKIDRARDMFYHRWKKLIVMTERFYFYKRYVIKSVASLVFYQLPMNAEFYTDLINDSQPTGRLESKVLFCKFDLLRMQNILGAVQGKKLVKAEAPYHAMTSD